MFSWMVYVRPLFISFGFFSNIHALFPQIIYKNTGTPAVDLKLIIDPIRMSEIWDNDDSFIYFWLLLSFLN
jgi:hypothetical protein